MFPNFIILHVACVKQEVPMEVTCRLSFIIDILITDNFNYNWQAAWCPLLRTFFLSLRTYPGIKICWVCFCCNLWEVIWHFDYYTENRTREKNRNRWDFKFNHNNRNRNWGTDWRIEWRNKTENSTTGLDNEKRKCHSSMMKWGGKWWTQWRRGRGGWQWRPSVRRWASKEKRGNQINITQTKTTSSPNKQ